MALATDGRAWHKYTKYSPQHLAQSKLQIYHGEKQNDTQRQRVSPRKQFNYGLTFDKLRHFI